MQGHFGERDRGIPPQRARQEMDQIRTEAGVPVEAHFYDAGHAFFNDRNPMGTHNAEEASLAWDRALGFLHSHLATS